MAFKRDPEQLWRALAKEADADERAFQEAANATVAETEKALADAGVDVKTERERGAALRRQLEARVAARKARAAAAAAAEKAAVKTSASPPSRSSRRQPRQVPATLVWLGVTVGAAAGGIGVYVSSHPPISGLLPGGGSTATSHPVEPPPPTLPEPVSAADHRRLGLTACDESRWDECLAELEVARSLDPDGDDAPEVQAARRRALAALLGGLKPKRK